jgi:serine/threonine protein kinase
LWDDGLVPDDKLTPNSEQGERDTSCFLGPGFLIGGGRFSLLRELGRGGMGVIWLAHDERLAAPVALKFLPFSVRSKPAALNDLRQETKKSRMLSHPNIIRIYDLYEAPDELPFISMEYVEGPSMWALRAEQPKSFFTWEFLKPIVKQLCGALDYAHGEKVIHRDLKPANMLLDERRRLRLSDFGIAAPLVKTIGDSTGQFRSTGTPAYMSPQQIEGKMARATDDIYSLGATLYELLTGQAPFYENDIAYQVVNVLPTPLADRLAELGIDNPVPPPVAAMIMACLSKDPEKRPHSARAVAAWIGMTESGPASPKVVPVAFPGAKTDTPVSPTTEKTNPFEGIDKDSPPLERTDRAGIVVLAGVAAIGLLTVFAWDHLAPKRPELPVVKAASAPIAPVAVNTNIPADMPPSSPASLLPLAIDLAAVNTEKGLSQVTMPEYGITTPANVGGKDCRKFEPRKNARCYFQIPPSLKRPGLANARVQVEYYAAAPGTMQLRYDGTSRQTPHYTNGGRTSFDGTNIWRITNFQLNDAVFRNGQLGGADFCLVSNCRELYIHSVALFFDE